MASLEIDPLAPFQTRLHRRWIPTEMTQAPALHPNAPAAALEPRYALLINPFYRKDAHASFGKHVLRMCCNFGGLRLVA